MLIACNQRQDHHPFACAHTTTAAARHPSQRRHCCKASTAAAALQCLLCNGCSALLAQETLQDRRCRSWRLFHVLKQHMSHLCGPRIVYLRGLEELRTPYAKNEVFTRLQNRPLCPCDADLPLPDTTAFLVADVAMAATTLLVQLVSSCNRIYNITQRTVTEP